MPEQSIRNRRVILRQRPGRLIAAGDTEIAAAPIPDLAEGEALVRTALIAMDPVTRVIINEDIGLVRPIALGEPLRSFGVGVVVDSRDAALPVGAKVTGFFEWAEWQVATEGPRTQVLPDGASLEAGLNVYGHTAMAAYFGMLDVGKPKAGETVVVSGAAGAVGSVASQIAHIQGARVIGIAGGETKRRWLVDELGLDAAVDYKTAGWAEQVAALAPDSVDLLFDNVGGVILQAILPLVSAGGRVVSCGASAQYASAAPLAAPINPAGASILRYNAMDYGPRFGEAVEQMLAWEREGRLKFPHMAVEGLEQAPDALNMLFDGRSLGRVMVRII